MRKVLISLIFIASFLFVNGQQVTDDQWSLFTKRTAEWCPRCGEWGWTMMENSLEALNGENVIIWALHFSGDLQNQPSTDITANFGGGYQPVFYVNNTDINVLQHNVEDKVIEAKETIQALNAIQAPVGVNIKAQLINDNTLNITGKIKFFENSNGEYYLGIYEVEDHIIYNQAGYGSDADHRKLLRRSLSEGSFGTMVANGSISSGMELPIEVNVSDYSTSNPENIEIVAIIWKKTEDSKYLFINGFPDRSLDVTSSVYENPIEETLNAFYNGFNHSIVIRNLKSSNNDGTISLYEINGNLAFKKSFESLSTANIELSLPDIPSGIYILEFKNVKDNLNKKISINR